MKSFTMNLLLTAAVSALFLLICVPCEAAETSPKQHYYEYNGAEFEKKTLVKPENMADKSAQLRSKKSFTGQSFQDQVIYHLLKNRENGYFIDLAANHYIKLSNSYQLEQKFGWTGLCIEPNSLYLEELVHRRSCQVLLNPVSDVNGEDIMFRMNSVFGGVVAPEKGVTEASSPNTKRSEHIPDVALKTVTLPTILNYFQAPSVIDFFSLDVEGAEMLVMKGMEGFWDRYTFVTLLIERPTEPLHILLVKQGYWFLRKLNSWGDCVYVHPSVPNFDKHIMQRPPLTMGDVSYQRKAHSYLLINATTLLQGK